MRTRSITTCGWSAVRIADAMTWKRPAALTIILSRTFPSRKSNCIVTGDTFRHAAVVVGRVSDAAIWSCRAHTSDRARLLAGYGRDHLGISREKTDDLLWQLFGLDLNRAETLGHIRWGATLFDPVVRLRADMSREDISEYYIPPHFTNIQHALQMSRQFLAAQDTPNRQIILITDGLPTAHFEGSHLYLLYPPDASTEAATLREGLRCQREDITINIFLLPGWSQSSEDVQFAYRLAESTKGRVFFPAGRDLDRYVVWDYRSRRREIIA